MTNIRASRNEFNFNMKESRFFTKDNENYINIVSKKQLRTIGRLVLLDVFLSAGNIVEPHYHINASELIYGIRGEAIVTLIDPKTNQLEQMRVRPQEVVTIPQGWWHYFQATAQNTHLLTIYDTNELETVWGSDIFRFTPPKALAKAYCLDEQLVQEAFAPIKDTVIIGPPNDCHHQFQQLPPPMTNQFTPLYPNYPYAQPMSLPYHFY